MSAKSSTGSATPSVQTWIIDSDVENQLRSAALHWRLKDKSLSHGSIDLSLRFPNLTGIGWGEFQPFNMCLSLLRVYLTGCPKPESISEESFGGCSHLVSVVFGKHINITNLGLAAFSDCFALTSITLPDKLTIIEQMAFSNCTSLERVVCNKNLKTIGDRAFQGCSVLKIITLPDKLTVIEIGTFSRCTSFERVVCNKNLKTIGNGAFQKCPKLEDVQLASNSISFGRHQFFHAIT